MARIGVLGGMGPLATVDFMDKLVKLTPASRDQEHIPVIVANLPHVHDCSDAILGNGKNPLPQLLEGIELLNNVAAGVVVIPCNSAHHWFEALCQASKAPVLHIAKVAVEAIISDGVSKVAIFATEGALTCGIYQRELESKEIPYLLPEAQRGQLAINDCIREIKAGNFERGGHYLSMACKEAADHGASTLILGNNELPIAAQYADVQGLTLLDSTLELARASVEYALIRGWNRLGWDS